MGLHSILFTSYPYVAFQTVNVIFVFFKMNRLLNLSGIFLRIIYLVFPCAECFGVYNKAGKNFFVGLKQLCRLAVLSLRTQRIYLVDNRGDIIVDVCKIVFGDFMLL